MQRRLISPYGNGLRLRSLCLQRLAHSFGRGGCVTVSDHATLIGKDEMSESMVGAIRVTLEDEAAADDVHAIADAVSLLRPVIEVDTLGLDPQAQMVSAHARLCIRLDWPQICSERDKVVCRGASRSMMATLQSVYYGDQVKRIQDAIGRVRGVAAAELVFVDDDHADLVKSEVERIKSNVLALVE